MEKLIMNDGNILHISIDEYAESPREWDNLATFVCFHSRYNLGDSHEIDADDYYSWEDMIEDNTLPNDIVLPLYLYDHSGLALNYEPFGCRWDSGTVGYAVVTTQDIVREYGADTEENRAMALKVLKGEIKTYHQYLSGQVYSYTLFSPDGEILDSCCGFYGYDHEKSGLLQCAGYKKEDAA